MSKFFLGQHAVTSEGDLCPAVDPVAVATSGVTRPAELFSASGFRVELTPNWTHQNRVKFSFLAAYRGFEGSAAPTQPTKKR